MNIFLTAQELLTQQKDEAVPDCRNLVNLKADLLLTDDTVKILRDLLLKNSDISGFNILSSTDKSLGKISCDAFLSYMSSLRMMRNRQQSSMGGSIEQLEGSLTVNAPVFVCERHNPPVKNRNSIPKMPIQCPECGQPMALSL